MDLHPGPDAEALRAATAEWLVSRLPLDRASNRPAGLWDELEAMGWTALTLSEDKGGPGLDHATEALVFAELGRHLAPLALISTAVARRWTGLDRRAALAIPDGAAGWRVLDPEGADRAIAVADQALGLFAFTSGEARPTIDLSTRQVRIGDASLDPIEAPAALLHLRVLLAAYAVGAADAARDMAVEYAKLREQFGQPIGAFQAIKHICADMAVQSAVARSQLYYAACALQEGDADVGFYIAAAQMLAVRAAIANGRANIQVHGGIGMTDEARAHLPLKRAHLLEHIAPPALRALL
ncbi:MAG: acyl-CoA dehydrogenase [Novosphingobium sp.]|nr:acyl-CoA dehydrogenase [Novosphingobium sp.]